ncbi:MAG TPA: asparagine synthase-related protein, partial [Terriglobales bacterium]|nr:asparagine synthase-related protein [Terriglobales bacterium]
EMVDDSLSEHEIKQRGLFQSDVVRSFITEHHDGGQDWSVQIWQFLTLELWMQNFIDNAKRMPADISQEAATA